MLKCVEFTTLTTRKTERLKLPNALGKIIVNGLYRLLNFRPLGCGKPLAYHGVDDRLRCLASLATISSTRIN